MTTIASIILSVLMGLSQNVAAYTGISNIQCNPALIINLARIIKGISNTKKVYKAFETYSKVKAAEDAIDVARSLFDNSENTAQEEVKMAEKPQAFTTKSKNNGQKKSGNKQSSQKLENWHKDFQQDNYTKQDASKTSQTRKHNAGKKASRKNRRKQIAQLPLPEREKQDNKIEVAVLVEGDYDLLY